jgi:hypothetical protein
MIATRVRAATLMVVISIVSVLLAGTGSAGPPIKTISILVYAGQSIFPGAQMEGFVGRVGEPSYMEAILSVAAAPLPCPVCATAGRFPFDLYVGAIRPDGDVVAWVGTPQALSVVTGTAPVPLLVDVDPYPVERTDTIMRLQFTTTEPVGLYVLYDIAVRTGGAPFDPASWIATHFYPFQLTQAVEGALTRDLHTGR